MGGFQKPRHKLSEHVTSVKDSKNNFYDFKTVINIYPFKMLRTKFNCHITLDKVQTSALYALYTRGGSIWAKIKNCLGP